MNHLCLALIVVLCLAANRPGSIQTLVQASRDAAVITGTVLDGRTGRPLRRAIVRLEARDGGSDLLVTSDSTGRFRFEGLGPGRYQITAQRGGFGVGGFALELAEGQRLEHADITLRPGGVITGRVVDEYGDPAPDIQVDALRFYTNISGYRVQDGGNRGAVTNDLGEFRIWGLRPGDYYVVATQLDRAPSYAPGTARAAEAWRLEIESGNTYDTSIMLVEARTLSVSGTVVGANGQPFIGPTNVASGSIRVYERRSRTMIGSAARELEPNGRFRISGLEPGDYLIEIVGTTTPDQDVVEVAQAAVTLGASDVDNVMMKAVMPSTVSGRVTLKEGARSQLNLSALKVFADYLDHFIQVHPAPVSNDLTFAVKAYPGRNALVLLDYGPPGWALSAVTLNGEDITEGFDVPVGQDLRGVELILTARPTMLAGSVVGAVGRSPQAPFVGVIIFAQEPARRRTGFGQWWVRASRDGSFSLKVRPGDYYVTAVDDLNMSQAFDPAILESLAPTAHAVSVAEGERGDVRIRVQAVRH